MACRFILQNLSQRHLLHSTLAATCHPSISQVLVADSHLAEPWAKLIQLVQLKGGYSQAIGSFGKNILPHM
ncbi:hypothetical protein V6N13_073744 [Hibiscus sabdariffa]|uniref:Uncharacterized protein n=2 Tax=Hibiscus sabdariffa TaxID=183260 RepID=A0ABR1ZKU0_9ROSI